MDARLDEVFEHKPVPCLVVTHGTRIIGASPLDMNRDAECHLVSGPCILNEYRNRGIGTQLLYHSLVALREAGLTQARGITKSNLPVAKFVYSKFRSLAEPYEFEPEGDSVGPLLSIGAGLVDSVRRAGRSSSNRSRPVPGRQRSRSSAPSAR